MQDYYSSKQNASHDREALAKAQALYTAQDAFGAEKLVDHSSDESNNQFDDAYAKLEGIPALSVALDGIEEKGLPSKNVSFDLRFVDTCSNLFADASLFSYHQKQSEFIFHSFVTHDESYKFLKEHGREGVEKGYILLTEALKRKNSSPWSGSVFLKDKHLEKCIHDDTVTSTVQRLKDVLSEEGALWEDRKSKYSLANDTQSRDIMKLCGHYMSLGEVAEVFCLNRLQKKAFYVAGNALLRKIFEGYAELDEKAKTKPFTIYLGGEAGTRKTRVIEALSFLGRSWQRPGAVRTCAPTGLAASLVYGQTIHSLLGIRARKRFNTRKRLSRALKDDHIGTMMLIIDEVSMLSGQILGAIDMFLRQAKECDLQFGGVIVIFAGDLFQIPPVASDAVYTNPGLGNASALDLFGYQAWQSIENVIILQESMRHLNDPRYSNCLGRIRSGKTTKEDLELLNTRVIARKEITFQKSSENLHLVVRANELRMMLNWRAVCACAETKIFKPLICVADVRASDGTYLSAADVEVLMNESGSATSNTAVLLPLIPSMPVRISQNVAVSLGITNGVEATLVGVSFAKGVSFHHATIFGVQCSVCYQLPEIAYLQSKMFARTLPRRFPSLPDRYSDDTIPVTPRKVEDITPKTKKKLR